MKLLIEYAKSFLGTPYIWGGNNPTKGYDCSGFIQELLESVGLDPIGDQTAHGLYLHFKKNGTLKTSVDAYEGDLAFYGTANKISHVALCLDHYRCIEAGGGSSKITNREQAANANAAFIRIRPIRYRSDFNCIITPHYNKFMRWSD